MSLISELHGSLRSVAVGRRQILSACLLVAVACSCGDRGSAGGDETDDGAAEGGIDTGGGIEVCPHEYFGELDVQWTLDAAAQDLVAADLDGDGFPELVVTRDGQPMVVLRNRGGQPAAHGKSFDLPIAIEGRNAWSVRATDWNGDGLTDLVAVGGRVLLFENRGDLSFRQVNDEARIEHGSTYLGLADMNGDGREDIIVYGGRGMSIYPAPDADGVLGEPFSLELGPLDLRRGDLGDLDGDGIPDLVVAARVGDPFVVVVHGDGKGGFERTTTYEAPTSMGGLEAAIVDINVDGILDVVVVGSTIAEEVVDRQPRLVWMRGIAGGGLEEAATLELTPGSSGWTLAHADLDNGGFPEIVALAGGLVSASTPGFFDLLSYDEQRLHVVARGFMEAGTVWGRILIEDVDRDGRYDFIRATGGVSVQWGCPR
jgi:hypothetical protein